MTIYHGSQFIIEKPEFGKGNKFNDYGLGFYCTESLDLAKEWACIDNETNGYANKYEIDLSLLKVLDLRSDDYNILNWMAILLKYRTFDTNNEISRQAKDFLLNNYYIDVDGFDVIIGFRADDSYFSFAKDFINNSITVEQLSRAMLLGNLGIQVVLKSEKAFDSIKYLSSDVAPCREFYIKRVARDNQARKEYLSSNRKSGVEGTYIMDIIRQGRTE